MPAKLANNMRVYWQFEWNFRRAESSLFCFMGGKGKRESRGRKEGRVNRGREETREGREEPREGGGNERQGSLRGESWRRERDGRKTGEMK